MGGCETTKTKPTHMNVSAYMRTIIGCCDCLPHTSLPIPVVITASRAHRLCYHNYFVLFLFFVFVFVVLVLCWFVLPPAAVLPLPQADHGLQRILRPTTPSSRISWTYQTNRRQQKWQDRKGQDKGGKGSSDDQPDPDDDRDHRFPCFPLQSTPPSQTWFQRRLLFLPLFLHTAAIRSRSQ